MKNLLALCLVVALTVPGFAEDPLRFLSNQLAPLPEADRMKTHILRGFTSLVDFQAYDDRDLFKQLALESATGKSGFALIGCLYEDFLFLYHAGVLGKVDSIWSGLSDRRFIDRLSALGKLGQENRYFIPWMQATYLMVANKKALKFLPKEADLNHLTYAQLEEWAVNVHLATGEPKLGFPVGSKGLMHRFIQGFLYPSFTGSMTEKFNSPEAERMWRGFRNLWKHVNARSLAYDRMDLPLLNEEVWIAWDHTARLKDVFQKRSNDFVALPSPIGPKGRGFLLVLAGLGLPRGASHQKAAELIEYLTRTEIQIRTMSSVGFFPVLELDDKEKLPQSFSELYNAVLQQTDTADAVPTFQPIRFGGSGKHLDLVFLTAFSKIVLRGQDIPSILEVQESTLQEIFENR